MTAPCPAAAARRQIDAGVRCPRCLRLLAAGARCDCPGLTATETLDRILRYCDAILVDAADLTADLSHDLVYGPALWEFEPLCRAMGLRSSAAAAWLMKGGDLFAWDRDTEAIDAAISYVASPKDRRYFVGESGVELLAQHSRAPLAVAVDAVAEQIAENMATYGTADVPVAVVRGVPIVKTPEGALRIAREADEVRSDFAVDEGAP
jgi:hypothetical protein